MKKGKRHPVGALGCLRWHHSILGRPGREELTLHHSLHAPHPAPPEKAFPAPPAPDASLAVQECSAPQWRLRGRAGRGAREQLKRSNPRLSGVSSIHPFPHRKPAHPGPGPAPPI